MACSRSSAIAAAPGHSSFFYSMSCNQPIFWPQPAVVSGIRMLILSLLIRSLHYFMPVIEEILANRKRQIIPTGFRWERFFNPKCGLFDFLLGSTAALNSKAAAGRGLGYL
jgi:hypothetical protein